MRITFRSVEPPELATLVPMREFYAGERLPFERGIGSRGFGREAAA